MGKNYHLTARKLKTKTRSFGSCYSARTAHSDKSRSFSAHALTHYKWQILDSFKLKAFADDNFKFDENGRKLSKRVENTVGKGEIARYEQFLLFPQCFQKACFPGASKGVIVWEWVNQPFKKKQGSTITYGADTPFKKRQTDGVILRQITFQ